VRARARARALQLGDVVAPLYPGKVGLLRRLTVEHVHRDGSVSCVWYVGDLGPYRATFTAREARDELRRIT